MFKKIINAGKTFMEMVEEGKKIVDKELDKKYNKIETANEYLLKREVSIKNNLGFFLK